MDFFAVFDGVGERGRRVGCGIRAVQHHELVMAVVAADNNIVDVHLVCRLYARIVDIRWLYDVQLANSHGLRYVACEFLSCKGGDIPVSFLRNGYFSRDN